MSRRKYATGEMQPTAELPDRLDLGTAPADAADSGALVNLGLANISHMVSATIEPTCWWTDYHGADVKRCPDPTDGESPYCAEHRPYGWVAAIDDEHPTP